MAGNQEQRALYSGNTMIMTLPESIGMERFLAIGSDFKIQLTNRSQIPSLFRTLIADMFKQRVITRCEIVYGTKAIFTLSETDADGHRLTCDVKRQRFEEAYMAITNRPIKVIYQLDELVRSSRGRGGRSSSHGDGFWSVVGDVIESLLSGD